MSDDAPGRPPTSRDAGSAHTFAWAAFVACGASVALLLFAVVTEALDARHATDHVGAGIEAAASFLLMTAVLVVALLGLALAFAARRRAPGDPFVELALGTSMLTPVALLVLGPLLLSIVD